MRLLFSARPSFGHVYPILPLALAARAAGHDVTIATTEPFLTRLARLGLATHNVGVSIDDGRDRLLRSLGLTKMPRPTVGRPDVWLGGRMFLEVIAPRTADDLLPVLEATGPDAVVYESYEIGAAVAAAKAEVPAICHAVSPRLPDDVSSMLGEPLAALWARYGVVEPPLDVFAGDLYLDSFPGMLQDRVPSAERLAVRPVTFTEPGATVPDWIAGSERPLVYVTLGTVVATDDGLRPVVEGLGGLDADVLVALGAAAGEHLGPLPPNVRVEPFVDQAAVLRVADLAIHHGGSGTLLGALAGGTPQILLPTGADQFWNAARVDAAGLAAVIEPEQVSAATIAAAATAELGSRRPAAMAARDELTAMPDPTAVVAELDHRLGRGAEAA